MSTKILDESFSIVNRLLAEYSTTIFFATTAVVAIWLFNKLWINRRLYSSTISMKGKTVLITGANAGIGYETAKDLLQRDARVIMACRNLNRGQQSLNQLVSETGCDENNIRLMECDLCSLGSVRAFAKLYNEEEERLDVLICNAGLSWASPMVTTDGFNSIIQANYLGHFLLTYLLLDKLKKCRRSRVINVSSKLHNKIKSINWLDVFTQSRALPWFGSVRAFAKLYNEEEERLDVLICNAGLSWASPMVTADGFNSIIQANYLGHFLLTYLLLDKLKKCRRSRVINVSSKLHNKIKSINWLDVFTQSRALPWFGAYPSSKLFQILSTVKLRQQLYDEGIDVFTLTPGWVSTSLSNPTPQAIGWLGFIFCYPLVRFLKFFMAKTPKTGASTVIFCAVEPSLEQSEDLYFQNCKAVKPSSLAINQLSADRLWKLSRTAVELQ
ncbi:unnamed protein product [Rotaria socialis]